MIYMVTKQPSPGPSEEAADSNDDAQARYQPSDQADDAADDIEYYGPRRIHTKPTSHPSERNHYHSMPDMETFGILQKTGADLCHQEVHQRKMINHGQISLTNLRMDPIVK